MLIVVALIALFVGAGFGFLMCCVLSVGKRNDEMEDAQWTIRKQAKVIEDQGAIISELNHQLDCMEDDVK